MTQQRLASIDICLEVRPAPSRVAAPSDLKTSTESVTDSLVKIVDGQTRANFCRLRAPACCADPSRDAHRDDARDCARARCWGARTRPRQPLLPLYKESKENIFAKMLLAKRRRRDEPVVRSDITSRPRLVRFPEKNNVLELEKILQQFTNTEKIPKQ